MTLPGPAVIGGHEIVPLPQGQIVPRSVINQISKAAQGRGADSTRFWVASRSGKSSLLDRIGSLGTIGDIWAHDLFQRKLAVSAPQATRHSGGSAKLEEEMTKIALALLLCVIKLTAGGITSQLATLDQVPGKVEEVLARKDVHKQKRYVVIHMKDGKKRRGFLESTGSDATSLVLHREPIPKKAPSAITDKTTVIPIAAIAKIRIRKNQPRGLQYAIAGATVLLVVSGLTLNEPLITIALPLYVGVTIVTIVATIRPPYHTITLP